MAPAGVGKRLELKIVVDGLEDMGVRALRMLDGGTLTAIREKLAHTWASFYSIGDGASRKTENCSKVFISNRQHMSWYSDWLSTISHAVSL